MKVRKMIICVVVSCLVISFACAEENRNPLTEKIDQLKQEAAEWASDRLDEASEWVDNAIDDTLEFAGQKVEDAAKWIVDRTATATPVPVDEDISPTPSAAGTPEPVEEAAGTATDTPVPDGENSAGEPEKKPEPSKGIEIPVTLIWALLGLGLLLAVIGMVKRAEKKEKNNQF